MTLEELLECDASSLEKMSDEELLKHFSPYLNVTRPELAPRKSSSNPVQSQMSFAMKQNIQKLAALGIDVTDALKGKKFK